MIPRVFFLKTRNVVFAFGFWIVDRILCRERKTGSVAVRGRVCVWSRLLEANGWQGVVDAGVVSPCPRRFAAPYGAAIRPGQLVLLSAKDSVKAYMRGVDLGCDPASWFSVADASMGKDGRPDLHNVPTHPRCTCPWGGRTRQVMYSKLAREIIDRVCTSVRPSSHVADTDAPHETIDGVQQARVRN